MILKRKRPTNHVSRLIIGITGLAGVTEVHSALSSRSLSILSSRSEIALS